MLGEKLAFCIKFLTGLLLCVPSILFAETSFVMCMVNGCPTIAKILEKNEKLTNQAIIFQTDRNQGFMQRSVEHFSTTNNGGWQQILIDETAFKPVFPIVGFGGAFTDSSALLYAHLAPSLKKALIDAYFSQAGIGYSLGRVPIASSDFSCRKLDDSNLPVPSLDHCSSRYSPYTYADRPDESLRYFSLQAEDYSYKIPLIHAALQAVKQEHQTLRLYASPWSAPYWMKTNGQMVHGSLRIEQYQTWAEYIIKFLKAYKAAKIHFWGLTIQNEPVADKSRNDFQNWQTMFYSETEEAIFTKNNLGPALKKFSEESGEQIKLMIHDDQIQTVHERTKIIHDPELAQYISGAGVHWYANGFFSYLNLDKAYQNLNPANDASRFILATEACEGFLPHDKGPQLGSWVRGEDYAHDIISDLNHYVSGWTDWNLMLDMHGGPNWANNFVDAPILVDLNAQVLYKQPMYFYMGHFSKFIRPNSHLLASQSNGIFPLEEVSFKVPAYGNLPETIVIVVLNRDITNRQYYIQDNSIPNNKKYLNMNIPAHSIQTIIYRANVPFKHKKGGI